MGLSSKKKINNRFVSTVRVQSVNTFLDYQAHGFFVAIKNQDLLLLKKLVTRKQTHHEAGGGSSFCN